VQAARSENGGGPRDRAAQSPTLRAQVRFRGEADMDPQAKLAGSVENDPSATSGLISFCGDCGND